MKAAQFSSRGATPHEEQALLKQARSLMAASQDPSQPQAAVRGRGGRGGRGRGGRGAPAAPESPVADAQAPVSQDPTIAEASQGVCTAVLCLNQFSVCSQLALFAICSTLTGLLCALTYPEGTLKVASELHPYLLYRNYALHVVTHVG